MLLVLFAAHGAQLLVLVLGCGFAIGGGFVAATSAVNALRPPAGPSPSAARSWILLCATGLLGLALGVYGLMLVEPIDAPWLL